MEQIDNVQPNLNRYGLLLPIFNKDELGITRTTASDFTETDIRNFSKDAEAQYLSSNRNFKIDGIPAVCYDLYLLRSNTPLIITDPPPVCESGTVDLTAPAVTIGNNDGLTFTYWKDEAATLILTNPDKVSTGGTYYIKGTLGESAEIKLVKVQIYPLPNLVIHDPPAVCAPSFVDLTDTLITDESGEGLTLTYWKNAAATNMLTNPGELRSSGTYYIKGTAPETGCSVILPVRITIYPVPRLVINDPTPVCHPQTVDLTSPAITG